VFRLYVAVRLAIHESYVILGAGASGPEVAKEITGGEAGVQRAGRPTTSKD
jgi:hypothetical protein